MQVNNPSVLFTLAPVDVDTAVLNTTLAWPANVAFTARAPIGFLISPGNTVPYFLYLTYRARPSNVKMRGLYLHRVGLDSGYQVRLGTTTLLRTLASPAAGASTAAAPASLLAPAD